MNRLTDDQSQARVREEAEAVEGILRMVGEAQATWVSSAVLEIEIGRNPDPDRRRDVTALLAFSNEVLGAQPRLAGRAAHLQSLGFGAFYVYIGPVQETTLAIVTAGWKAQPSGTS